MAFTLPDLGYAFDALEPHIDAHTMEIHHDKHHQAYVDKTNAALEGVDIGGKSIEAVLSNLSGIPADKKQAVINNGGGHANHSMFWDILTPGGASAPSGDLAAAIDSDLGGVDACKEAFENAAATRFGSGWAWLVNDDGKLAVMSSANQDSPLSEGKTPLLTLDVWEHAYYLNYQNRRPDYIKAFWNVVNWDKVAERFASSK
ncbi:MAG TPA: superoxide dismutase [Gammaproteobacteria bacterium]|nr:superoxide dismutase [Candidatus Hydrogenedentota bacterium]HJP36901.1 superoxide dismutase [Gammaproteobacteria bacterium]